RLPSYLTATGRAILAQLPKSEVLAMFQSETAFVSRTGRGPTSVKALNAVLAQERRAGCAIEHGEVTPGISTIAAPVYVVLVVRMAAIVVSLISEGLSVYMPPVVDRVQTAAAEVTALLR